MQELHDLQHHAVGRRFQFRFTGVEQHVAQRHHQTAVGLGGGQCQDLLFEPFALLLHTEQFGLTQCQLQTLPFQFEFCRFFFVERLIGVFPGNGAIALAQVGVMHHVRTTAPIAGQAIGTGQGLTGANHVLGGDSQHIGVFLDLLKVGSGLLQRGLAVLADTTREAGGQDQTAKGFALEAH
ncbi:hypothetical protein D3C73_830840 [compost metagenome]